MSGKQPRGAGIGSGLCLEDKGLNCQYTLAAKGLMPKPLLLEEFLTALVDVGPFTVTFSNDFKHHWIINVKCMFRFCNGSRCHESVINCGINVSGFKREGSSGS
jgi:hypothetical protein